MQTPSSAQERAFMKQLEANGSIVFQYENQELLVRLKFTTCKKKLREIQQDKAMEVIPLQRLYEEAEAKLEEQGGEGSLEDLVIQRLLHWFKSDFFVWVNNAPCEYCQNVSMHIKPEKGSLG